MTEKNTKKMKYVIDVYTHGRHHNINPIFLSQAYFGIHKDIRLNASHILIWPGSNFNDLKAIWQDHARQLDFNEFCKIHDEVVSVPYQFLVIDKENNVLRCGLD